MTNNCFDYSENIQLIVVCTLLKRNTKICKIHGKKNTLKT